MVSTLAAAVLATLGLSGLTGQPAVKPAAQPAPKPAAASFFVAGHGWGHGVGLAQYGAYGYALHGWTYDQIVAHYFPGTTLGQAPVKKVRVLLAGSSKRAVISSRSPFTVKDGSGKTYKLPAGQQQLGPALQLKLAAPKTPKALPGPLVFSPGSSALALGDRSYRGTFRVTGGKSIRVVNTVGLESYLYGVVPSEMPDRWPAEALAAQAVVARTYALSHLHVGGDFDLYPDTRSQVYGGIPAESPTAKAAVDKTAGQIVLYDGEPADTFFFSSSGGRTANVQDVWYSSKPQPYLVSVPDPYDTLSPYHNWGPLRFSTARLGKQLGARGTLTDVQTDATPSGRVRAVTVVGSKGSRTITGTAVRAALGLRSTWFAIAMLNLTPPARPLLYGTQTQLAGLARGLPRVTLDSRPYGGQWKPLAPLTSRSGRVSATLSPSVTTDYRLSSGQIQSPVVRLSVAPLVRLAASADRTAMTGVVKPLLPGAAVQVQRKVGTSWTTVARSTVNPVGTFKATLDVTPGTYRARVVAGKGFAIGVSTVLQVVSA
jgi:stage II sporulation protein D